MIEVKKGGDASARIIALLETSQTLQMFFSSLLREEIDLKSNLRYLDSESIGKILKLYTGAALDTIPGRSPLKGESRAAKMIKDDEKPGIIIYCLVECPDLIDPLRENVITAIGRQVLYRSELGILNYIEIQPSLNKIEEKVKEELTIESLYTWPKKISELYEEELGKLAKDKEIIEMIQNNNKYHPEE